jgi:hypothetical protein
VNLRRAERPSIFIVSFTYVSLSVGGALTIVDANSTKSTRIIVELPRQYGPDSDTSRSPGGWVE